jgi:hypothetical protein
VCGRFPFAIREGSGPDIGRRLSRAPVAAVGPPAPLLHIHPSNGEQPLQRSQAASVLDWSNRWAHPLSGSIGSRGR